MPRDQLRPPVVLRAPKRMGSRQAARDLLADTPENLDGFFVVVNCEGSWPTTSFVDELIVEVVVKRGASHVIFTECGASLVELVGWLAAEREVGERVSCEMADEQGESVEW